MSIGCFVGPLRNAYAAEAQESAAKYAQAIDAKLRAEGLPGYREAAEDTDVYVADLFGRSALDRQSPDCFVKLASQANENGDAPHLGLVATNPYRVVFLPIDFEDPLLTDHTERLFGKQVGIWIGSAPRLLAELTAVAPGLGIPLQDGKLANPVAQQINDSAEDERTTWLLLYEGARLALENKVPLCLAG
jgi:hypothetical protein